FAWSLLGNAVYAAGQFLTLVLLAKLLSAEMVGQYTLGLAVVYPVMQFSNLQLRSVMNSDFRNRTEFGHYLGLRLLTTGAALLGIGFFSAAADYGARLSSVILMAGLAYAVETISDIYYARMQSNHQMAVIAKSMMARAALSSIVVAVIAYFSRN